VTEPRSGLVRSSLVVAAGTGLSRVSGLLRTIVLAYALGTTYLSDAYNLANTTPNIVYDLLLGGILAATLVPVFVDNVEHGDDDSTSAILTVVTVVLAALTTVAVLAAPWIIHVYTWRLPPDVAAQQESVAVPLLRLFLPQILFYGLTTLGTALLNARKSFAVPAFAPVLNNIVVIVVLLAFSRAAGRDVTLDQVQDDTGLLLLLGLGTTLGIVAMTVVLWPAIRHAKVPLRWRFDWRDHGLRTVVRLSGWTFGAVVANQVALFVTLALAYSTGQGDVSAYTYAFIFFQLPFGLLAVSIMTTFMPELATNATRNDLPGFRDRFSQGLRLILLSIMPAAVGMAILAGSLLSVLLEWGAFGATSVTNTADALVLFAVGLPGFSVFLWAMRGFYAFKDTRTPFLLYVLENAINIALAFALVGRFGLEGVIAAYSIAYSVSAVVALVVLRRRTGGLGGRAAMTSLGRTVVAAAVMGVVVAGITALTTSDSRTADLVDVVVGVSAGLAAYVGTLLLLRSPDLAWFTQRLGRRRARSDGPSMS